VSESQSSKTCEVTEPGSAVCGESSNIICYEASAFFSQASSLLNFWSRQAQARGQLSFERKMHATKKIRMIGNAGGKRGSHCWNVQRTPHKTVFTSAQAWGIEDLQPCEKVFLYQDQLMSCTVDRSTSNAQSNATQMMCLSCVQPLHTMTHQSIRTLCHHSRPLDALCNQNFSLVCDKHNLHEGALCRSGTLQNSSATLARGVCHVFAKNMLRQISASP